jgi:hypothetical protein
MVSSYKSSSCYLNCFRSVVADTISGNTLINENNRIRMCCTSGYALIPDSSKVSPMTDPVIIGIPMHIDIIVPPIVTSYVFLF